MGHEDENTGKKALEMFSQRGYAGTNIRELTAALGMAKSSMYKHFEGKATIWNTRRREHREQGLV